MISYELPTKSKKIMNYCEIAMEITYISQMHARKNKNKVIQLTKSYKDTCRTCKFGM